MIALDSFGLIFQNNIFCLDRANDLVVANKERWSRSVKNSQTHMILLGDNFNASKEEEDMMICWFDLILFWVLLCCVYSIGLIVNNYFIFYIYLLFYFFTFLFFYYIIATT